MENISQLWRLNSLVCASHLGFLLPCCPGNRYTRSTLRTLVLQAFRKQRRKANFFVHHLWFVTFIYSRAFVSEAGRASLLLNPRPTSSLIFGIYQVLLQCLIFNCLFKEKPPFPHFKRFLSVHRGDTWQLFIFVLFLVFCSILPLACSSVWTFNPGSKLCFYLSDFSTVISPIKNKLHMIH